MGWYDPDRCKLTRPLFHTDELRLISRDCTEKSENNGVSVRALFALAQCLPTPPSLIVNSRLAACPNNGKASVTYCRAGSMDLTHVNCKSRDAKDYRYTETIN